MKNYTARYKSVVFNRLMLAAGIICVFVAKLPAQDAAELLTRMKAMEERIRTLEAEVQTLKGQPPPATPAPPVEQAPSPPVSYGGAGPAAAKVFNPDISVIGDFLGAVGNGANRPTPALEMHESEIGLQAVIDPYARADVFLSFGEQGVNLEEGYLTFTSLPGALQLRAGKMRAAFGKINTLHNHALPWTDRPLVTQNLVAGEEGISDAGLSLSRILPAPKNIFLEGTAQIFRGDTEGLFRAARRSDVSTVGHLRAYRDISESTNLDLGVSYARGHSPDADGSNQLYGLDATLRWKPLRRAIYRSFVARSEFLWAHTDVSEVPQLALLNRRTITPFGYYVSGDYQLGRRWFLGGRFDRSERGACLPTFPSTSADCSALPVSPLVQDTGGSVLLTYWPSEFSQIRGQLRRTKYGEGPTANEFLFQFVFSMGAHGAHPF